MTKKNRLVDGIIVGALIGAGVALLNKDTRRTVMSEGKKLTHKVIETIENPEELKKQMMDQISEVRESISQFSDDVAFLSKKINELTDVTPQMLDVFKSGKDRVISRSDDVEESE